MQIDIPQAIFDKLAIQWDRANTVLIGGKPVRLTLDSVLPVTTGNISAYRNEGRKFTNMLHLLWQYIPKVNVFKHTNSSIDHINQDIHTILSRVNKSSGLQKLFLLMSYFLLVRQSSDQIMDFPHDKKERIDAWNVAIKQITNAIMAHEQGRLIEFEPLY